MADQGSQSATNRRVAAGLPVICLVLLSLTVSLATRTFHLNVPHGVSAQSSASEATRQHMDRDGVRWTPLPLVTIVLQVTSFYPRVAPAGPPLPSQLFDKSLYNRPPPSC